MRLLFIGDVVGGPGRRGLRETMPSLRERYEPDLIVVNGENSAGGMGITERTANDIFDTGAAVITTGNHVYRHRDAYPFLERERAGDPPGQLPERQPRPRPHHGRGGRDAGRGDQPQRRGRAEGRPLPLRRGRRDPRTLGDADAVIVDFHAEVTSEKVAMGWHLDGRVAAVLGTHTHVPTADARVLPKGTAFISDVGMTGSRQSILGVRIEDALGALVTQMPTRFETADQDVWVMGAVVDVNQSGLAESIEPVMVPAPVA